MSQSSSAEAHLVEHYAHLEDIRADFRNYNLFVLLAGLVRGRRVVDVGCGLGWLLRILQERGKEVMGIEPSDELRALAARLNPTVPIQAGEAEDIERLLPQPADSILLVDVLEHLPDDTGEVQKIRASLTESGVFVVAVPAHSFLYGVRDRQMGHYRRYSKKGLRRLLEANGFVVESLRHWNALGVLPYFVSERILRRPLESGLRHAARPGTLSALAQKLLFWWFSRVENNFDFHCGLSIIGVARKTH